MTDLLKTPFSHAGDLGKPMPGWPHATSVCMPKWADNIDYEKGDSRVTNGLACGYPRFIFHPYIKSLFAECEHRFAQNSERCMALPSSAAAEICQRFLHEKTGIKPRCHSFGVHGIVALSFPETLMELARDFWQHSGEIVSTRHAYAALENVNITADVQSIESSLKERISGLADVSDDDVYLFPSGMSAIFNIYRAFQTLLPNKKSVQFGFPYVDTLKIQQIFGYGCHFFPRGNGADLQKLEKILQQDEIMGLFCEFPMNPLMTSPDLHALGSLAGKYHFPIIVDDTIGTFANVRVLPPADVQVTSLTKFFSGVGDVMGGSAILNRESPFYEDLKHYLDSRYENCLWHEDMIVLEHNSRDFLQRMTRINSTAELLCERLNQHPAVDVLYYPKLQGGENFMNFQTPEGGFSGVFSILLKKPGMNTERFFDRLNVCKGPSLGTRFSLACPYTILAHYKELDFAESCGVSKYLIRFSIGMEESNDLIDRFDDALSIL